MFHRKLERQQAGKPITARTLNRIMDLLEKVANIRVSPPLAMSDTATGPHIYLSRNIVNWAWGTTPSGGYTGGTLTSPNSNGNGTTLYSFPNGPTFSVTTTYSTYSGSVSANKTALYMQASDGKWYVVTTDC